jgi:hypothetical protein
MCQPRNQSYGKQILLGTPTITLNQSAFLLCKDGQADFWLLRGDCSPFGLEPYGRMTERIVKLERGRCGFRF